jgi:hypothetical protein
LVFPSKFLEQAWEDFISWFFFISFINQCPLPHFKIILKEIKIILKEKEVSLL